MTVRLELKPDVEANLAAQARARGVPLDAYLQSAIEELAQANATSAASPQDVEATLDRLAEMGRGLPHLPSSASSRESIYRYHDWGHVDSPGGTNILLRFVEPNDPEHALARKAVRFLTATGENLCFTSQNLVEFWNVCTRPLSNNGLGLRPAQTDERATLLESIFQLIPDNERIHAEWRRLVVAHSVSGVQVHDARLVAAMLAHGVPQLLTLNDRDFARYPGISAVHPREVVSRGGQGE